MSDPEELEFEADYERAIEALVPRWVCAYGNSQMIEEPTGNYIHINDVEKMLRQAEQRGREDFLQETDLYEQGQRDALANNALINEIRNEQFQKGLEAAVQRVEAQASMWSEGTLTRMGIGIALAAIKEEN